MLRMASGLLLALFLLLLSPGVSSAGPATEEETFAAFATELEALRQALHIPGMSAGVVRDQELVWAHGFGYAGVEDHTPATSDTPYHLASVTKPIAATVLMQLVDEGVLRLDDPVARYDVDHLGPDVTIWHLLTHTSGGIPGTVHDYDGNRYALLGDVMANATGQSFGQLLTERILVPLKMVHTAPNPAWAGAGLEGYLAALGLTSAYRSFPQVYRALARPYQFDEAYENVPGSYPLAFQSAAGLLSSVTDLARFDIALDQDRLLPPQRKEAMLTPAVTIDGSERAYGLGWYVQQYQGTRLVWHSGGWSPSVSALLVKVPDAGLTFIILANNYNLTSPFPLGSGDVLYSTPALAFYRTFAFPRLTGKTVPVIAWEAESDQIVAQLRQVDDPQVRDLLERELWSYRKLYASVGRAGDAARLATIYRRALQATATAAPAALATQTNPMPPSQRPPSLMPFAAAVAAGALFIWLLVVAASWLLLLRSLLRHTALPRPLKLAWLFAALPFGPLALLAYRLSDGRGDAGGQMPTWRRALAPTLYHAAANGAGLSLGLLLYIHLIGDGSGGGPYGILGMFLVSWLCFRAPLLAWARRNWSPATWLRALPLALVATIVVMAGALPVMLFLTEGLFRGASADTPFFWCAVLMAIVAGALPLYPLQLWHVRRGRSTWLAPQLTAAPLAPASDTVPATI